MSKAILFINPKKDNVQTLAAEIIRELGLRNIKADSFTFGKSKRINLNRSYDIAFSLGGDGTVLYAARLMAPLGVPIFPINLGTLGFIAAVHPEDWVRVFDSWRSNQACLSKRLMLEARVVRKDKDVSRLNCLNDIVISSLGNAKLIRLHVYSCAKESGALMSLGQYRSDGLIMATPTGSTAYSVAAGGPILDPEMEAFILNPICPFTLSYRPMVLPATETLMIEVEPGQRSEVLLTVDGQETKPLKQGDRVFVSRTRQAILIASDRTVFYNALKTKLSWMETPGTAEIFHA
ncbi:MAG: NAD(+)/NADH kinase [Treponema sp.]|jgi:NAD+ kinase|nr:NAD(+)/NADH kinase [Treponema sp.]